MSSPSSPSRARYPVGEERFFGVAAQASSGAAVNFIIENGGRAPMPCHCSVSWRVRPPLSPTFSNRPRGTALVSFEQGPPPRTVVSFPFYAVRQKHLAHVDKYRAAHCPRDGAENPHPSCRRGEKRRHDPYPRTQPLGRAGIIASTSTQTEDASPFVDTDRIHLRIM